MRRMRFGFIFLSFLLVACTEVAVKEVRECSRVGHKEVTRQYWLGFIPSDELFNKSYLVLKNGQKINVTGWRESKVSQWLERESDGSGKIYCYDKYEWKK